MHVEEFKTKSGAEVSTASTKKGDDIFTDVTISIQHQPGENHKQAVKRVAQEIVESK